MTRLSFEHHPAQGTGGLGALSLPLRFTRRIVAAWRLHRAEREMEALPFDLRKDIGFPAAGRTAR